MARARVFPLKIDEEEEINLGVAPTPSMVKLGIEEAELDAKRNKHASAHLHGGSLPELLQDIYEIPEGLERLAETDFITVESQLDSEEVLLGYDSDYRFQILNHNGDRIFFAGKVSSWKTRHIFWRCNSYEIHAMDYEGAGIFSISCKGSCCKDVISVYLEDGLLGTLICGCKIFPSIDIKDDDGTGILRAVMTTCPCCNCYSGSATFDIKIIGTNNNIGKIEKLTKKSHNNNSEHYSINFRRDINVRVKVMLIATLFHVGSRFLNTRYATLDRRLHADLVQDTDENSVLNAIADENSGLGSDESIHERKDSDNTPQKAETSEKAKTESEEEKERRDSEKERAREMADKLKTKRNLGILKARKKSADEKAKAELEMENAKTELEEEKPATAENLEMEQEKLKELEKKNNRMPYENRKSDEIEELLALDLPDLHPPPPLKKHHQQHARKRKNSNPKPENPDTPSKTKIE